MEPIPVDDTQEYYAYYISRKDVEWEPVAYAEEDMMLFKMESIDKPIEKLYELAMKQSALREIKVIREPNQKVGHEASEHKLPKIFISHSSKDTLFVNALVELLLQVGFIKEEIFCSSIPGSGVKLGEDIFEAILNQFQQYDLYVIFVHSPRFYRSPISLNEMGAAWALRKRYYSILTKDMSYDDMKAVVGDQKIAIKVNENNAIDRVFEFMVSLQIVFDKKPINIDELRQKCTDFIHKVNEIYYTQFGEVEKKQYWKFALLQVLNAMAKRLGV